MDAASRIEGAIASAEERWPGIALDRGEVGAFLEDRARDRPEGVALEDLCLAWACLRGDRVALGALEALLAQVPSWLRRSPGDPDVAELVQTLRAQLVVGPEALLAKFEGRGALHAWLRITARRLSWRLDAAGDREVPLGDGERADDASRARRNDPERALAGATAGPVVLEAVREGFARLDAKQRTLLRLRHGEGLTDEAIGRMYRVHQTTATRWIAAAHATVRDAVRARLRDQLHASPTEIDSLIGAAESGLDLSLSALLRPVERA